MRDVAARLGYEVELRREGKVVFYAPKLPSEKGFAPTDLPVFFNPISKPNRDMTILLLASRYRGARIRICEALAGTGVRSIRIARETDVAEEIVANDISPRAYELIKLNAELNHVEKVVRAVNMDANELLAGCGRGKMRYDYVDIDPAGTPAHFLENGFRGCAREGVLGATATDMSALTGARPEPCLRKYDAKPMKTPFSKELALRILVGFMVRTAARLGLAAKPILCFQKDHYVRAFVEVERGKTLARESLKGLGWASYCPTCAAIHVSRRVEEPVTTCPSCGSKIEYAGPLWIRGLSDGKLVSEMLARAREESEVYHDVLKLLEALSREDTSIVGYHPVNVIAERLKRPPIKPSRLIEGLRGMGYRATGTHIDPSGVKTDAPLEAVREVFEQELGSPTP